MWVKSGAFEVSCKVKLVDNIKVNGEKVTALLTRLATTCTLTDDGGWSNLNFNDDLGILEGMSADSYPEYIKKRADYIEKYPFTGNF